MKSKIFSLLYGPYLLINNLQNVILQQLGFEMTFEIKPIEKYLIFNMNLMLLH